MSKTRIAVYGSLLSGLGNHGTLAQHMHRDGAVTFVGEDRIKGFDLYAVSSFPGIKKAYSMHKSVQVEIYDVDDRALASVRALEGYNPGGHNTFYDEIDAITHNHGTVRAYLYMMDLHNAPHVKDGNWRPYRQQMKEKYGW
jgi:gamma-glutamylcyclotransferase (GGCT)/AIG2-like uncharacterized protein YtfP